MYNYVLQQIDVFQFVEADMFTAVLKTADEMDFAFPANQVLFN